MNIACYLAKELLGRIKGQEADPSNLCPQDKDIISVCEYLLQGGSPLASAHCAHCNNLLSHDGSCYVCSPPKKTPIEVCPACYKSQCICTPEPVGATSAKTVVCTECHQEKCVCKVALAMGDIVTVARHALLKGREVRVSLSYGDVKHTCDIDNDVQLALELAKAGDLLAEEVTATITWKRYPAHLAAKAAKARQLIHELSTER